MKKFINVLLIINGLIIPVFLSILIYNHFTKTPDETEPEPGGIIVGEEFEQAKRDSLALQGISYDRLLPIYNSTNFYLPISAKTFEEARQLVRDQNSAGDFYSGWFNYVNVLFLDKEYGVIGRLLDKKASIEEIKVLGYNHYDDEPIDKTAKNMAYMIGYDDSNKDGTLNYLDDHDLYITDLDGRNLTKATRDIDVLDFTFIKSNSEILIQYSDRSTMRDEYKQVKFAIYKISTGEFKELKAIGDSLNEIEAILLK